MINISVKRRKIAITMLCIWGINLLIPTLSYALTSGPAQPETKGFQVAGVSDMVDLQSGGLQYNIPLLDIDGYPINLSYASGVEIDDEASWVGLGWSLNPGAVNRQVRGLPDDFSGDVVETDHYVKPKVTVGGRLTAKVEFHGIARPSGSFTFGVFSDNYTGIGAELGVNAGISYSLANDGMLTAGLGVGVLSNTQSGVGLDVSPYISLSVRDNSDARKTVNAGLSGSFGYNTRSGLKALTLGASFGLGYTEYDEKGKAEKNESGGVNYSLLGSTISYNTEPISPSIQIPFTSDYSSYSFDFGGEVVGLFGSVGGTGYQNIRQVKTVKNPKPAFGFLYAERGKDNQDAVMDFIRENDNPIIPELPNIALPIHTPDIWSYTSQSGSGQFRLYRGGSGIFFDNQAVDGSTVTTAGGDLGAGAWFHGGVTYFNQHTKTTTHKWTNSNSYMVNGDFQKPDYTKSGAEHVYFRQVGEKNVEDQHLDSLLSGSQALQVSTQGMTANSSFRNAGNLHGPAIPVSLPIAKTTRRPNRTVISYLTAAEASQAALSKTIPTYAFNDISGYPALTSTPVLSQTFYRIDSTLVDSTNIHKLHHISEMTVTDDGGKKMVYGIPVYNVYQNEYTFAIDPSTRDVNNLVSVPALTSPLTTPSSNSNGLDNYYNKEHKPSYATSYLLTAILSPDYVDKTGNGITDDDLGTAIKFNYSKLPYYYKWRTPYSKASPNRSLLADPDDDKGSIVYGKKEIWYVQSIESKTKIAYFITQDRRDALGVTGWQSGTRDLSNKQKCLTQIRLYSKADMTRPIKVVKFQYTYELCRGIPNSADMNSSDTTLAGKLTLSKVWFEYGNSDKGKNHPYVFRYNKRSADSAAVDSGRVKYAYSVTDRWGAYKAPIENTNHLDNERFPYTSQNKTSLDVNCALWHLNRVILPTGGIINISYESGDYAYVQNQKAMVMTGIQKMVKDTTGILATDTTAALNQAKGLMVPIDTTGAGGHDPTTWFKNNYLNSSNYMYTKLYVNMATNNYNKTNPIPYDMVPTYCLVNKVKIIAGNAYIYFTPVTAGSVTKNPISIAAWQRMKNEYPRYAYPGFDNRVASGNNSVKAAVAAIVNAAKNLAELKMNFYQKAYSRGYANTVILGKSFVKLTKTTGFKLGGPARVKKIQISDTWTASGVNFQSSYGQAYTYTTVENGRTISSGVATYEPAIGNDENALKQPVPYIQNIKGAINNYFDLELPFGESLYPAPSVGYSKVTVNDLDKTQAPSKATGYIVNEFYTAKDYPVKVTALPIISGGGRPHSQYSLVYSNSDDELSLSQGYSIELNDMNGKSKATTIYDQSDAVISSTAYYYNSQDNGGVLTLNNNVNVIDPVTLQLSSQVLGRDVDFFTDFREQESSNKGTAVNIGGDVFPVPPFLPFFGLPHFPANLNNDYKLFRSACAVKVIQSYGILNKVVKTENGSSITTENLAYDGLTGEALVTRTGNEFKKYIYSVNIPAYWAYKGMGAAYQNLGVLLSGFKTNTNGEITTYTTYLQGGDEILDTKTGNHYWVIDNQAVSGGGTTKKLIDRNGLIQTSYTAAALVKIVKSGFHNMLTSSTTTLVSLNSPFTADNHLQLISSGDLTALKVINASATTFDESWGMGHTCVKNNYITNNQSYFNFTSNVDFTPPTDSAKVYPDRTGGTPGISSSYYWRSLGGYNTNGAIARTNIWPASFLSSTVTSSDVVGFDTCITFSSAKDCFLGSGTATGIIIIIDGTTVHQYWNTNINKHYWSIEPWHFAAGTHTIRIEFPVKNLYYTITDIGAGFEIYDNTYLQLLNAPDNGSGINTIFSTIGLASTAKARSFWLINGFTVSPGPIYYHYTNLDGSPLPVCSPFSGTLVTNPYITGFLGNWRPYQTKVFQQSRNYAFAANMTKPGIDIKNAGYLNNFFSYWYFNTGTSTWTVNPNGSKWITANTVTLYDKYGQQLENMDALGRFSAANFDFNGELPSAVASNAMNREIYAASLEDSKFVPGSSANSDTCNIREFIQPSTKYSIKRLAVNTISHSGNYSALLPTDGVTLSTIIDSIRQKTAPYLGIDAQKQYVVLSTTGLYPNGFEPYTSKKYTFDAWVNDGLPNDKSVNLSLTINTNNVPLTCKAVVEGWKLMEGTMDLSTLGAATALNISIVPNNGHTIYIDDIRMHPFDAQMKTYAYDDKTMRLMAEIDENGFATFYEYDDEGLLIRVKKETEKGIMTLKESRSSYRRIP